jgi:hypothetical protein
MIKETQKGFQCCADRHLIKSALAMAIYHKIGAITWHREKKQYQNYFAPLEGLADLFGCAPNSAWRAVAWLCKVGFLEKLGTTDGSEHQLIAVRFQSKNYRYVSHEEWAGKHPGECYQSLDPNWDALGEDSLARTLWSASNGNTRWYSNQLAGLRKTGWNDEQILQAWKEHILQLERPPVYRGQWKAAQGKFLRESKERAQSGGCIQAEA